MSCCCTTILRICKAVGACVGDVIALGMNAPEDGTYKLKVSFLGVDYFILKAFAEDDPLEFPTDKLNENHTFTGELIGASGEKIPIVTTTGSFDCVEFKTKIQFQISEPV